MTLKEWQAHIADQLKIAGIENPIREAKILFCAALQKDFSYIFTFDDREASVQEEEALNFFLNRRKQHEPLSRIKGKREFWGRTFYITSDTLDPRPDSEVIVSSVLEWSGVNKNKPLKILDFGTGSGCLLISLLSELPTSYGVGVDKCEKAIKVARKNAEFHEVSSRCDWVVSDWGAALEGKFDIIISNPPYIAEQDKDSLEREVKDYDPHAALFGGEDGLEEYRKLLFCLDHLLKSKGIAVFEIGIKQEEDVEKMIEKQGFMVQKKQKDLGGNIRCIIFSKKNT